MISSSRHTILPLSPGGVKIQKVDNGYLVTVSDGEDENSEKVLVFNTMSSLHMFLARHFMPELTVNLADALNVRPIGVAKGSQSFDPRQEEPPYNSHLIDWDEVPSKFKYVAVDRDVDGDRFVYAYTKAPTYQQYEDGDKVVWDDTSNTYDDFTRISPLDDIADQLRTDVVYQRPLGIIGTSCS